MKRIVVATVISGVLALWMGHSAVAGETGPYVGASGLGWYDFDSVNADFGNSRTPGNSQLNTNGRTAVNVDLPDKETFDITDKDLGALVRIGYDLGPGRIEAEIGYRYTNNVGVERHPNDEGHIYLYTGMVNLVAEPWTFYSITPYVSVGGGVVHARGNIQYDGLNNSSFNAKAGGTNEPNAREDVDFVGTAPAGQIGLGVGYALSPGVNIVGGYSAFAGATDGKGNRGNGQLFVIHSASLGLNYTF